MLAAKYKQKYQNFLTFIVTAIFRLGEGMTYDSKYIKMEDLAKLKKKKEKKNITCSTESQYY